MNNVLLKEIEESDLFKIAAVHLDAFPESALTKLGHRIVQRYYLWQLIGPHKKVRSIGAFVNGDCAGFCFSGVFNGSISGFINHNKTFLAKEIILKPWLLFNPLFLKRLHFGINLLRRFSHKKKQPEDSKTVASPNFAILAIAVSNQYQKMGIGRMLMLDVENEARNYGYKQIRLTVNQQNDKAIEFYENLNWKKSLKGKVWEGAMIKTL